MDRAETDGISTRADISTGDQEAIRIMLEPKYAEDLSERELAFIEDLAARIKTGHTTWTLRQEDWFNAIWQRVMA